MDNKLKKDQHFWHFITASTYGLIVLAMVAFLDQQDRIPDRMPLFDFFMLTLATFRVTRLLVHDLVSDFLRDAFENSTQGLGLTLRDLLGCPWCTGAWVALGLGFAYFVTPLAWPVLLILGVAGFGTLLTILASLMMVWLNGK